MFGKIKIALMIFAIAMLNMSCNSENKAINLQQSACMNDTKVSSDKMIIQIILGSTRQGRTSEKIAKSLQQMADTRADVTTEIIDLRDYNLPFFNDEIAPASRKSITDPIIKKWSDKIKEAQAYIVVVPEYNAGYPAVLKNALDSLYQEWNHKPVAFVGYSGGPSGGTSAIAQLRTVVHALKMIPVASDINIPQSWKAFDEKGDMVNKNIQQELYTILDQIIQAQQTD